MKRPGILFVCGLILLLSVSCIDRDILNISDNLEIHSHYSVPVGKYVFDINNYLESLAGVTVPVPDSLYFEDVLYPNISSAVFFSFSDTFTFNLVRDPSGKVRSIEFVILLINGYPTDVSAQVYFLSGSSPATVDSVFAGGPIVVQPAEVNDVGVVTAPATNLFSFMMPSEFIPKLSLINGIIIQGHVNTTRSDIHHVKFYRNYQIDLHVGSRIELMFDTNQL